MADNTNKVTIDAAWFAELYAAAKDKSIYSGAVINIAKERDELKAKLAESERRYSQDHERMDAAERCIEEVSQELDGAGTLTEIRNAQSIIRSYREKEAK